MQALTLTSDMNSPAETTSKLSVTYCSISSKGVCLGRVFQEGVKTKNIAISRKRRLKLLSTSFAKDSLTSSRNS
jgi:hypothetical protein